MGATQPITARGFWATLIWAYVLVYTALLVAGFVRTGFHVGHNDFWGNYYQATQLDWSIPETLYDGFFPIGYPLYLRYGPFDDPIGAAFSLNAGAALVLLGLAGVYTLTLTPGPWAVASVVTLSLVPRLFAYAIAPTSDLIMTTLTFVGAASLAYGSITESITPGRRYLAWIAAGVLFGMAALLRQHGLVLAAGFLLGAGIVRRSLIPLIVPGAICALLYVPQIWINLNAGHSPFETYQHINIYKMIHRVRLYDVPADLPASPLAIIADAPAAFLSEWLKHFASMLPLLLPAALCALLARPRVIGKLGAIVVIAGVPYCAAVALGWSARAPLPLIPWTVITAACLAWEIDRRLCERGARGRDDARLLRRTSAILLALVLVSFAMRDLRLVRAYGRQHDRYVAVERALRDDGVVHPKQVFTTDPTLYLPNTPPYHAYFNGGWLRFSLYEYEERYPNLDLSSVTALARDARREGVTHLALTRAGANLSFALDHLYRHPQAHQGDFFYMGRVGPYRLYRRREPTPPALLTPQG